MPAFPLRRAVVLVVATVLLLAGCGDDSTLPQSAPPHVADVGCAPGEATLADGGCAPAGLPPDMPCPPGERALEDGACQAAGVPTDACGEGFVSDSQGGCDASLPKEVCPPGKMAVPGETACREVARCGQGLWGDIPVDATTVFVDQAYPGSDSDGSSQRPWRTIQDGVDAADREAIVAIAEGRYVEDVLVFGKPVRLWGRCPALVQVEGTGGRGSAILITRAQASGSEVRGVAVTGPTTGIVADGVSAATIEGVWVHENGNLGVVVLRAAGVVVRASLIEQNRDLGMLFQGSEATVESSVVRATQRNTTGRRGWGVSVEVDPATGERGALTVRASLIEQNRDLGVFVLGSEATVESSVVRATQLNSAGDGGFGVHVQNERSSGERGALVMRTSLLDQNRGYGLSVTGSEATVESSVVRATQPESAGEFGYGVDVEADAVTGERGALVMRASLVEQNHGYGVFLSGSEATVVSSLIEQNHRVGVFVAGSKATVESSVVRDNQPDRDGAGGNGVNVQGDPSTGERGALVLRASLVEQNSSVGVVVSGSDATVESSVVRTTKAIAVGTGYGVDVEVDSDTGERSTLVMRTSVVEQNQEIGVFVAGSEATIESSIVRATELNGEGRLGRGIDVETDVDTGERSVLVMRASVVDQNREAGVVVLGSEATIESSVVRATQPDGAGKNGRGIDVEADPDVGARASLVMRSSLVEQNLDVGVFFAGADVTIDASIVRATGVSPAGVLFGDGILSVDERDANTATITGTLVSGNTRAGILLTRTTGSIAGVQSTENRFGLVLQGEGRPALGEGNVFKDNTEQNEVENGDLPVPSTATPLP